MSEDKDKVLVRLTPNANSAYNWRGRTNYEHIELGNIGTKAPWGMVHIDLFYDRQTKDVESALHQRLLRGEEVVVELTIHEEGQP